MAPPTYTTTPAPNSSSFSLTWTDNNGFDFPTSVFVQFTNFTVTYYLYFNSVLVASRGGTGTNSITFSNINNIVAGTYTVSVIGQYNNYYETVTNYNEIATTNLFVCFVEGTEILCINDQGEEEYIKVEDMKPGMMVKTHIHGAKKLIAVDKREYKNDKSISQICKISGLPGQTKDLFLTGGHSILVDKLTDEQREKSHPYNSLERKIDGMELLLSHINENAEKLDDEETRNVYHIVLENDDEKGQYGVYANGVLAESMSIDCYNDINAILRVRPSNYIL